MLSSAPLIWWSALCVAAVANVVAWTVSAWALGRRKDHFPAGAYETRRRLLWLSAAYVLGCAFRSVLPMMDVPRLCLHDTWISRIFVGRSVATVAELAFAAQWALLLGEAGATRASRAIVPLIAVAEILSWIAVLTANDFLHAAENSVWALAAVFVVAFLASRWRLEEDRGKRVIAAAVGCAGAYVAFMAAYVVPMYLTRWHAGVAASRESLSLAEGLREMLARCVVERDWARWAEDAAWLTPYFTLAVWISIALVHVPSLKGDLRGEEATRR
jgi:hypothetical protein